MLVDVVVASQLAIWKQGVYVDLSISGPSSTTTQWNRYRQLVAASLRKVSMQVPPAGHGWTQRCCSGHSGIRHIRRSYWGHLAMRSRISRAESQDRLEEPSSVFDSDPSPHQR